MTMRRIVFASLLLFAFAATALSQQTPSSTLKNGYSPSAASNSSDETLTTPPQLRRVDPPSPDMTAEQLENTADDLRDDKMYADAMDYLKAAIKKAPNAVLYNKMGMVEIAMEKLSEAKRDFEKSSKLDPAYPDSLNNLG